MFCSGIASSAFRAAGIFLAVSAASPVVVSAHDAPTGWSYPFACCSAIDCRPVSASAVSERPEGFVINNTGEVLTYADTRIKNSPDGEYHWCSEAGEEKSRTICLFVPVRGF